MARALNDYTAPASEAARASTEADVVADLARRATEPHALYPADGLYAYIGPDGQPHVLDVEKYMESPRRIHGQATVRDVASLAGYVNKHHLDLKTEIWADTERSQVVAVINAASESGEPAWGDHRALLSLTTDPDWRAWVERDKQWWEQEDFAEFVVQHGVNVVKPDGATMLELVQSFQATKSAAFESSRRISNGEVQLTYKEDVEAKAGRSGTLQIPERLELALRPYEHSPLVKVQARFRYRIDQANLRLGYVLDRPEDAKRAAFDAIVEEIRKEIAAPVFFGVAPAVR